MEEEVSTKGAATVTIEHVQACRQRFLRSMEEEVQGYQVETCFGPGGCPNRAVEGEAVTEALEKVLASRNLKGFLKERVQGPLKMHHEFRISVSDCPNACSRPQIVDIGLIGASRPRVGKASCIQCDECLSACKEEAISLEDGRPSISEGQCLCCGACIRVCPTGTLGESVQGYRVLLGGKLGRHPRLGEELPGILSIEEIPAMVERCLDQYQRHCREGERLGGIMERLGLEEFLPLKAPYS